MTDAACFKLFRVLRVRTLQDGFEEAVNQTATLQTLQKAYLRFYVTEKETVKEKTGIDLRRLDKKTLKKLCDEELTRTEKDGVYNHLLVFLDSDDQEDFDAQHEAKLLAHNDTISSEEMTDKILANPNRKELVRGLIEDKRRLYGDCDELEEKVESLMKTIEVQAAALAQFRRSQEEIKKILALLASTLTTTVTS